VAALHDVVGPRNAQLMVLTGQMMPPEKALSLGFVDEVVPQSELLPRSKQVC
jgi:enoyl-CoA hydratase/carnithine racemase